MKKAIENTKRLIPEHYQTLLGERPSGSLWGRAFTEADFDLPWVEETVDGPEAVEGCRYFRLLGRDMAKHFPKAQTLAVPIGQVTNSRNNYSLLASVMVVNGAHGKCLELPDNLWDMVGGDDAPQEAWLILGPHEGEEIVFTAHPGPLMVPCPADVKSPMDAWDSDLPIAVKKAAPEEEEEPEQDDYYVPDHMDDGQ